MRRDGGAVMADKTGNLRRAHSRRKAARGQRHGPSGDQNVVRNPAITLRPP